MRIFNDEISGQLKEMLGEIPQDVHIAFFGSQIDCHSCQDTKNFMEEFTELHDKLHLSVYDRENDASLAKELGVTKVPSIILLDAQKRDHGVRFYGIPAGYEIHSLIASVKELGGVKADLPDDIESRVAKIDKDIHIQVFVTPTCPYCPGAVITGHRLAMLSDRIRADMVEANSFPEESARYGVRGVPKIIINESHEFVGSQPITKFLEIIEGI